MAPSSTPEGRIKKACCEWLELQRDVFFWNQESTGIWDPRMNAFRKKNSRFQRNGVPDLLIQLNVLGIPVLAGAEVKTPGNQQSDAQIEFERLMGPHAFYRVVRSVSDLIEFIGDVRLYARERILKAAAPGPAL